jgi:uncharacterized SAM-binding protein YcdF (DUF218 family)
MNIDQDLSLVASFLARRDTPHLEQVPHADFVVLLGSSLLVTVEIASKVFLSGTADRILVAGGIGHSTELLHEAVRNSPQFHHILVDDRPEAEILSEILVSHFGVPQSAILTETRSTNCGANAWEVKRVLFEQGLEPQRLLLIQDPTMQRRSHASFERAWRGDCGPEFISYAPFVPAVVNGVLSPPGQWTWHRFVSLIVGEIPRLIDEPSGYGPKGKDFIEHVEIPDEVLAAHARIAEWSGQSTRA